MIISINVPGEMVEEVDNYIHKDLNRSQIATEAFGLWLEKQKEAA